MRFSEMVQSHMTQAIIMKKKVVYPLGMINRIGELAKQMFFLRNLYGENEYAITVVTYPPHLLPGTNKSVYEVVMRGITVGHSTDSNFIRRGENQKAVSPIMIDKDTVCPACRLDIFQAMFWEKFRHEKPFYHFSLSESDIKKGNDLRHKLNIPESAPVVTLHARESGYVRDSSHNSYRNASIENYMPAINYLVNEGFYVVRLGDKSMKHFVNPPSQFIDAPFHPEYTDFFEPYFCGTSKFFIGCSSGPDMLAHGFGTPVLHSNASMQAYVWGNEKDLYVPKKIYSHQQGRYLTYEEFILSPAVVFAHDKRHDLAGIEFKENSSEEILMAVKEMNARLDGVYSSPGEIAKMNQRVQTIQAKAHYFRKHINPNLVKKLAPYPLYAAYLSTMQMSMEFIRLNPDFLGHEWPHIAEWGGAFPKLAD